MVYSMTGFGQASVQIDNKTFTVEIKSLNGKTTDLRMRVPSWLKDKEIALRRIILDKAVRGKIDTTISMTLEEGEFEYTLNKPLIEGYLRELQQIQQNLNIPNSDLIQAVIKIPNVVIPQEHQLSEEDWLNLKNCVNEALSSLSSFRQEEGKSIKADFKERIKTIRHALGQIAPYEAERITALKERILKNLSEFSNHSNVDKNRFEQEVLYYLEKLDINEEKVRLKQHCIYFDEVLEGNASEKGKKLGFIGQEIGREINTLGAKAQHSEIQKCVVQMKDELEKIKEQVLNIV